MSSIRRFLPLALAGLCFVVAFWGPQYARRGHWEPDEARFVYVAREMAATRSFMVPLRNGEIYAHKPPLMMWLVMAGEAAFGEPFGSRLPTLVGAVLSVLALFSIVARRAGRRIAAYAVLVACTSVQFWHALGFGQIDALLTGLVLSSAALFLSCRRDATAAEILPAFLCAGLATLAKGPVGLLLPVLIVAAMAIPEGAGSIPKLSPSRWCLGFSVALLVPALWLAAAALSGAPASYFREILFSQNISRAAGAYGHRKAFWYLLAAFPVGFLPWTLLLPAAAAVLYRRNRALLYQGALWAAFIILFFSLPVSKRSVYIVAAYPGAAIVVAAALDALWGRRWFRFAATSFAIALPAALCAAGLFLLWSNRGAALLNLPASCGSSVVGGVIAACMAGGLLSGLCVIALVSGGPSRNRAVVPLLSFAAALFSVGAFALPAFNPVKEPLDLVPVVGRHVPAGGRLLMFDINGESLALHAGRRGMRLDDDISMRAAMASEGSGIAVFSEKAATNLVERYSPLVRESGKFSMGRKKFVWVHYDAAPGASTQTNSEDAP